MLIAYFDDSGTHDAADVVVWAGLFGNNYQWDYLSELWKKKLAQPSPGKGLLERFHMTECQNAQGEFSGWSRTATDFLVHELTDILVRVGIWGYGIAIPRRDWQELIGRKFAAVNIDPESQCLWSVYIRSIEWAQNYSGQDKISYVFDQRPHREWENRLIFEEFQSLHGNKSIKLQPYSLDFASSRNILALQAADLFAWEIYQHGLDVSTRGRKLDNIRRPTLRRLIATNRFPVAIVSKTTIQLFAAMKPPTSRGEADALLTSLLRASS